MTTYHYDNNRTGWNNHESVLTPANISGGSFGLLQTVVLDGQVDAQPLVVPNVTITAGLHRGVHNVVYVATEGNSVYAIDTTSGAILLSSNFGLPILRPLGCNNNSLGVGITSTPVIDPNTNTLYVMVYTQPFQGTPAYYLHALDLGSLNDKVSPRLVSASHTLSDGSSFSFNASVQRQRPGLLLANGNIYAGFGSFCDAAGNESRGWLLGWQTGTLNPLAGNRLMDSIGTSSADFFLSSIWMSGYGLASDSAGNILFVTGNSDANGYDGVTDFQESVVKVSSDLTAVLDLFTPTNQPDLDNSDGDFGSGGVMLLPLQSGSVPYLAVAAGKDGNMYLMNENYLGGFSTSANYVLGTYQITRCWCGASYFQDPNDGLGRVVSSGGNSVGVWKVVTSPSTYLSLVSSSDFVVGGQGNPGFFTSVSSNGTSNPVIWALSHPNSTVQSTVNLFAFDPENGMNQLLMTAAGNWPYTNGNSNLVPVVANGNVFVGSYRQLRIFGLKK